jgi:ABC-type molybdate transport system substrate-binding protein
LSCRNFRHSNVTANGDNVFQGSSQPVAAHLHQLAKRAILERLNLPLKAARTMKTSASLALPLLAALCMTAAIAADIKVLTAGAYKPVLLAMQADFEAKTGAAAPDISTVIAFQNALLAARAVAYIDPAAGGSSGIYLSKLFDKWGMADRIKAKAVLVPGGLVAQRVVDGQADIAIHQISEILAVPGATLVGPIPAEIQNHTVYAGGVSTATADPVGARALLELLAGPNAASILKSKGMEAP